MITMEALSAMLLDELDGVEAGTPLSQLDESLIHLGSCASVTALDGTSLEHPITAAIAAGAMIVQIQEVVTLVSGLGTHSLMMTAPIILAQGRAAGLIDDQPIDEERRALWDKYVGDSGYWRRFEQAVPGFLDSLLHLSPAVFQGFFDYCALPWSTRSLPPLTSELIALATDVSPTHTFAPGARLHFGNALKLGAGRQAIERTLHIASSPRRFKLDKM